LNEAEEPKDQLPATITSAEIKSGSRAPNVVPALIADLGDANIRNPLTRWAYAGACARFFAWCEDHGLVPAAIRTHDAATYIEQLQNQVSAPSVKQQLAAIRMLFDWLVTGQVVRLIGQRLSASRNMLSSTVDRCSALGWSICPTRIVAHQTWWWFWYWTARAAWAWTLATAISASNYWDPNIH
jgi:hypothetical protein